MKTTGMTVGVMGIVCLVLAVRLAAQTDTAESGKTRVGTYDSRAIAIAYVGTQTFAKSLASLRAESEKAKTAGDQKRGAEMEAQAIEWQKLLHKQGFGTAPVDDILAKIKDQMPEIMMAARVSVIVSKWDKDAMARYKSAEKVDVTSALVDALHPDEKARKGAAEVQKQEPISLKEAENVKD